MQLFVSSCIKASFTYICLQLAAVPENYSPDNVVRAMTYNFRPGATAGPCPMKVPS